MNELLVGKVLSVKLHWSKLYSLMKISQKRLNSPWEIRGKNIRAKTQRRKGNHPLRLCVFARIFFFHHEAIVSKHRVVYLNILVLSLSNP